MLSLNVSALLSTAEAIAVNDLPPADALAGANVEYRRALQLKPSDLPARLKYAEHLSRMGRFDEAVAESRRALPLDPVSPLGHNMLAMLLWRTHRYEEAIRESRQAIELDPHFVNAFWWQGLAYAGKRDFPNSIAGLKQAISLNDGPLFRALLGHVYGLAGDRAKALSVLEWLATLSKQRYVSPVDFAVVYAGLGDADSTFHWLEKAYQTRTARVHELPQPYYDSLHSDPRYADLMSRIGLPLLAPNSARGVAGIEER